MPKTSQPEYELDLNLRLYKNPNLFMQKMDEYHVLYAPDHDGYPVIASPLAVSIMREFDTGNSAGRAVASATSRGHTFGKCVDIIAQLEEHGFLLAAAPKKRAIPTDFQKLPNALSVWLHINNHCNLDCSYCFVNKFTSEMTSETIRRVVGN